MGNQNVRELPFKIDVKGDDGVKRRVGFECTFENGMCNEWQGVNNNIRWIYKQFNDDKMDHPMEVVKGPQHSLFTGPRVDHTKKSIYGRYLYAPGLEADHGDVYITQTPDFDATQGPACISFWYHNMGSDFGSLQVFLASKHSDSPITLLWDTGSYDFRYKWPIEHSKTILDGARIKFTYTFTINSRFFMCFRKLGWSCTTL